MFSATKPKSDAEDTKKGGSQHGFQMAPDGRLIIREDKDKDEPLKKGQMKRVCICLKRFKMGSCIFKALKIVKI